jgi:chorismate mutase
MDASFDKKGAGLEVNAIAARLEGLEETIISKLIDRAQFRVNKRIYEPGKSGFKPVTKLSLFHLRLHHQERMDALFGRFTVPEERPFNHRLPKPNRTMPHLETGLHLDNFNRINLMPELVKQYLALVPRMCRSGDDGHYGSSTEHDTYALQAIARRVHYGSLYVAESKYRIDPNAFAPLVCKGDSAGIMEKLTRKEVEERILHRIRQKVVTAQEKANPLVRHVIDPSLVVDFYREAIIPLTKKGEALYLLHRGKRIR